MSSSELLNEKIFIAERHLSTQQLEEELADANLLHQLSIQLIQEDDTAGLYKKLVEAAVTIMRSQYGTMQILYPDAGKVGKLKILAASGFTPEAEKYWEWVYSNTGSSCGEVLRRLERVVIPNYETCEFMQNEPTLAIFLEGGIYAAQSTPLFSRSGKLLGMISTHWKYPYNPPQSHLHLLDILARQAADLIERTQTIEALKESEERLRVLTAELEEKVEERTKELQRSNDDLQQFAHVASHDLKEPVRKIRTFGLRLQKELEKATSENVNLYNEKILESASRMATMIEGVLAYSSFNALDHTLTVIDLNSLLSNIENDLEILIEQKEATIEYNSLPSVEGVEVLIYQLLYNLINNSLKFSKPDHKPVIKITSTVDRNAALIVIKDNGIGFSTEFNETIFNTFVRLNPKNKFDGTGLGLSLAKKIVERHHGTINATGRINEGAEFHITLPLKQLSPVN